jgi:RNA polymerase sigma-70 factor (ECF subfamily)
MAVTTDDRALLETFNSNPNKGFELIVTKFQERIYWQIRRLVKNHNDTEDIMQGVFLKAWKALPNFRADSGLYTWLFRIAHNETLTFLSKENKRKTVDIDPPLFENAIAIEGKSYSPEEIEEKLQAALQTLPEKQLLVFNLKYFDDLKFTEISTITGTSVGGLKASYHLAVKKIEEFLKED